jgi:hypothetical protein
MEDIPAEEGNCQFEALAVWHYGSRDSYHVIKEAIIQELLDEPSVYDVGYLEEGESLSDYIRRLQDPTLNEWGCEITLLAMANAFNVNVIVLSSSPGGSACYCFSPYYPAVEGSEPRNVYWLLLHNHHYEIVYDARWLICDAA